MKVCLIFPPVYLPIEGTKLTPPLGIHLLQSILEEKGINVKILPPYMLAPACKNKDRLQTMGFKENLFFRQAVEQADVLGLSCDSFNYGIGKIIIQNAREIRKDIIVVTGGVHATIFDEYVLKTSGADIVVRGEGEITFLEVLQALKNKKDLSEIAGITFLAGGKTIRRNPDRANLSPVEIENYSDIDFSNINLDYYHALPIETSRGCPYNCIFCSIVHHRVWRPLSVDFIKERLRVLSRLTTDIVFVDDAFTIDTDRAFKILEYVDRSEKNFHLTFEARVNNLASAPILKALNPQKIHKIQIGVECGYPEGLERIEKKITIEQVIKTSRRAREAGVAEKLLLSFIIGFPWETTKNCLKTYEFAAFLRKEFGVNTVINWWLPIPSRLWNELKTKAGLTAAVFDNPEWVMDEDLFLKTHPKISSREKAKMNYLLVNTRAITRNAVNGSR